MAFVTYDLMPLNIIGFLSLNILVKSVFEVVLEAFIRDGHRLEDSFQHVEISEDKNIFIA